MSDKEETPVKEVNENNDAEGEDEEILSIPPEGITIADINDSEQREKIMCDFTIKQVIGEGTFATVRLAVNKQTEEQVAIKIMEKSKIVQKEDKVRIEREIKVLKNLRHPNIVHLYSVIQTDEKIYLIMEYVKGKELFDYIVMKKKLSESESCLFYQQIISGIEYLHKIKYVHRDIKPENLLINEDTKELKIVDFGLSNIYTNPNKHLLSSACGSPSYAAPEMLNGEKYRAPPVDVWSSGIVLYAMLCGYLPFEDDDNDVLYDKICKGKFVIPNHVSEKARDLLNKILVTDPKKRLTIYQIKNHPWFHLYNDKGKLMISDGLILNKYVVPIDEEVVAFMSKKFSITEEKIRISILSNKHDDVSTIYYLLLNKKINNKKKSVADIKSDMFKKYCENKYNLFETYDKDLNKVLEDRKNGYSYNHQNLSQSKVLSSSLTDIQKKLDPETNSNSPKKKIIINIKSNRKNIDSAKRTRYLSPENKRQKLNIIHSNRESNKTHKENEKKKISKFHTNNIAFKQKNSENVKEKDKNINLSEKNKKEKQEKTNIKNEVKRNQNEKSKNNKDIKENIEDSNDKRNLINHREKKVHYEKKYDKNKLKKLPNQKISSNLKYKKDLKNSLNKNEISKATRIKTALFENATDKKKNKEKNDFKKPVSNEALKKKEEKEKIKKDNKKDKLEKLNTYKTPMKTNENNAKINIKSKIIKKISKNKTYEISERGNKRNNVLNKTGGLPNPKKEIMLSEDSKRSKQKIKMKAIPEKQETRHKNINKSEEKQKIISFHTNNNLSQDIYNKILENQNSKNRKIKHFSSYNSKKPNNKLIKSMDINNEKLLSNKCMLFKQKNIPILENENNENVKESFSKIDEDSILISNKKLNCYEPFDLNLAYIKPRKILKEELVKLFDKNKIKYKGTSNTRFVVELKKEDAVLGIKFDKLNFINDENEEKDNNIRISIIKLRKIKGNYQQELKGFEKILYKLN